MDPILSILVPTFNEARTVEQVLRRVLAVPFGVSIEVVVVDDGSSDESARIVAALAREESAVRLIIHPRNLGKGAAVRTAMRRHGESFLARADRRLAQYDRDRNPRAKGGERRIAGIGIYYFEAFHGSSPPREPTRRSRVLPSRGATKAGKAGRGKKERRP